MHATRCVEGAVWVFTPKGWDNLAQGNALGWMYFRESSLKGWDNESKFVVVPALQAGRFKHQFTQGVALG
jgi:hypothetical protein